MERGSSRLRAREHWIPGATIIGINRWKAKRRSGFPTVHESLKSAEFLWSLAVGKHETAEARVIADVASLALFDGEASRLHLHGCYPFGAGRQTTLNRLRNLSARCLDDTGRKCRRTGEHNLHLERRVLQTQKLLD